MIWKTFNEWVSEGLYIIKGQKATRKNGICLFSNEQVISLKDAEEKKFNRIKKHVEYSRAMYVNRMNAEGITDSSLSTGVVTCGDKEETINWLLRVAGRTLRKHHELFVSLDEVDEKLATDWEREDMDEFNPTHDFEFEPVLDYFQYGHR